MAEFAQIVANHRALANAFDGVRALPNFDNSNAILEQLRLMREEMRQNHRQVQQELAALSCRIAASTTNSSARMNNSHRINANDQLYPLVNVDTAEPIAGFPATPAQLSELSAQEATAILRALGDNGKGTRSEQCGRLKLAVGLPNV